MSTPKATRPCAGWLAAALVAACTTLGTAAPAGETPSDAQALLADAFARRFEVDLTSEVELVMRDAAGREHRRVFDAASKMIDGRLHSLGRLSWPSYLRNMTILTIEQAGRNHDAFVYLPSTGRVRRISTAQRGDAFFGTDVTYEDLERRHADELVVEGMTHGRYQGEPAYVVRARATARLSFERAEYVLAEHDLAILEMRYYREGAETPHRVIRSPRAGMRQQGGHLVPSVLVVENRARGTTTTATFRQLAIDPEIDSRIFSTGMLARDRKGAKGVGR